MMTVMARKTSLENKHLRNCDYFAIISSCSHFTMLAKNPITGLVFAPYRELKIYGCIGLSRHQNGKCGNFTLLFCNGQHGFVHKCVPHVQHDYFSSLDQSNV